MIVPPDTRVDAQAGTVAFEGVTYHLQPARQLDGTLSDIALDVFVEGVCLGHVGLDGWSSVRSVRPIEALTARARVLPQIAMLWRVRDFATLRATCGSLFDEIVRLPLLYTDPASPEVALRIRALVAEAEWFVTVYDVLNPLPVCPSCGGVRSAAYDGVCTQRLCSAPRVDAP